MSFDVTQPTTEQASQKAKKKATERRRPITRTPKTENLKAGELVRVPLSEASFIEDPAMQYRGRIKGSASKLIPANVSMLMNVAKEAGGRFHDPIRLARITNRKQGFKGCVVIDGFHRIEALRRAGFKTAEVVIEDMTREEAKRAAALANAYHGRGLGNEDLGHVIAKAVREGLLFDKDGKKLSIADACASITGNRISSRQFRRYVEKILGVEEYTEMYGRDDGGEDETKTRRAKTVDYVAEARGLLDELWELTERVACEGDELHKKQCAMEIAGRMAEMQNKLDGIWDEFARPPEPGEVDGQPF